MSKNVTQKILEKHLVEGTLNTGKEIGIRIDQTLTQDATGTMAYLQFEAMGLKKVQTELSVSYVDHNILQTSFENADDHAYLQSVAAKYGILFSKPGNGICHQVHLERFGKPGKTLLGSDSHTPTDGGIGALAIGAGGLDVAVAMGGGAFFLNTPKVVGVKLTGKLQEWVSAKDIILELLRRLTVKGGTGKVIEYYGEGVKSLSVPERATITNMGAELGATSSIFSSDEITKNYLMMQGRENDWSELHADEGCAYDEHVEINLNELEPMIACPSSPDNVKKVSEVEGLVVSQVLVGSCTNSSYRDLSIISSILDGKVVHEHVSMGVNPGSKQVLENITASGKLLNFISAGVRVNESGCGGCIGMGQAPPSGAVSVRTFNRNFPGRSGTADDKVYLCSPETAAACAIYGKITDPRKLGEYPRVNMPEKYVVDDRMIILPSLQPENVQVVRGPNIAPLPLAEALPNTIEKKVLLKVGDNISTDGIMPAGAKILPLRSNIPKISEYVFSPIDPNFAKNARENNGGVVVGGDNYGQGSSREHAALAPMFLGVKAVIVKTFARIHKANLINFGILPLEFVNPADYDKINAGDVLMLDGLHEHLNGNTHELVLKNKTKNVDIPVKEEYTTRQREMLLAGGLLNYTKNKNAS
jgi:aconitate hydratase